jgi:hypothetical protein
MFLYFERPALPRLSRAPAAPPAESMTDPRAQLQATLGDSYTIERIREGRARNADAIRQQQRQDCRPRSTSL